MLEAVTLNAGVFQIAYLVPDVETAMSEWSKRTGAGPWFIKRNFVGIKQQGGGVEDNASSTIALAQAGAAQVELIELDAGTEAFFGAIIDASRHWDGTEPHREVSNGSDGDAQ